MCCSDVALKKAQTLSNCHSKTLGFTMANHFVKNHETQSSYRFWKQTLPPLHIKWQQQTQIMKNPETQHCSKLRHKPISL